ncbi:uncharacterized protein BJ171DRAFT_499584 [Polychytrium aggregatum]|uniref:uncharacterized protein n=1 Tax=Polychytrium aggregatum TaxID=110093 RepID=UPI0022FE8C26|nr:uncharacterized protein BJ171DRAFT_499584 [Polychytrium aggregatum]KAI9205778.1 hypothetical protein BJ171DRAFT_499584 [Polychytrium aggregatum]
MPDQLPPLASFEPVRSTVISVPSDKDVPDVPFAAPPVLELANGPSHTVQFTSSQYSQATPSACTILATEAALRILYMTETVSKAELPDRVDSSWGDSVIAAASRYTSSTHLDFETLHEKVQRYRRNLVVEKMIQCPVTNLRAELQTILSQHNNSTSRSRPLAFVITKPPETISAVFVPVPYYRPAGNARRKRDKGKKRAVIDSKPAPPLRTTSITYDRKFALFDSHPRPPLLQSSYVQFDQSFDAFTNALERLFTPVESIAGLTAYERHQLELMSIAQVNVMHLSPEAHDAIQRGVFHFDANTDASLINDIESLSRWG